MAQGILAAALVAAVALGGDFGVASASGEPAVGNRILLSLEVEVLTSADVVVAHLIQPGEQQETISLSGGDDGVFRGAATVPRADLVVVFEAVRGPGDSSLSAPATLTELGLDRGLFGDVVAPIEESAVTEPVPGIGGPLVVAIVSGVLSLVLIGWWVWSSARTEPDDQPSVSETDSDSPEAEDSAESSVPEAAD